MIVYLLIEFSVGENIPFQVVSPGYFPRSILSSDLFKIFEELLTFLPYELFRGHFLLSCFQRYKVNSIVVIDTPILAIAEISVSPTAAADPIQLIK